MIDDLSAQTPASCINRSDIIRMALEAELNAHSLVIDRLERFAELVAAHEREECAKIAEEWMVGIDDPQYQCDCATAIRRGKK
jgi:metal-responsive CopG/Arc/MetJ family transcriptional regulator